MLSSWYVLVHELPSHRKVFPIYFAHLTITGSPLLSRGQSAGGRHARLGREGCRSSQRPYPSTDRSSSERYAVSSTPSIILNVCMDAMLRPSAWLRSVLVPSTPSLRHPRLIEARLPAPSLHIHSFHQLFSTTRVPQRSPSALHYLRGSSAIPLKPYTWRTPLSVTPSYPLNATRH